MNRTKATAYVITKPIFICPEQRLKIWVSVLSQRYLAIKGDEGDLRDLAEMLWSQRISCFLCPKSEEVLPKPEFSPEEIEQELAELREELEEIHVDRSYAYGPIIYALAGAVIVEASKELVEAIFEWLKKRNKKGLEKPRLKIYFEGNVLHLNAKDMRILASILEKTLEEKVKTKKGVIQTREPKKHRKKG